MALIPIILMLIINDDHSAREMTQGTGCCLCINSYSRTFVPPPPPPAVFRGPWLAGGNLRMPVHPWQQTRHSHCCHVGRSDVLWRIRWESQNPPLQPPPPPPPWGINIKGIVPIALLGLKVPMAGTPSKPWFWLWRLVLETSQYKCSSCSWVCVRACSRACALACACVCGGSCSCACVCRRRCGCRPGFSTACTADLWSPSPGYVESTKRIIRARQRVQAWSVTHLHITLRCGMSWLEWDAIVAAGMPPRRPRGRSWGGREAGTSRKRRRKGRGRGERGGFPARPTICPWVSEDAVMHLTQVTNSQSNSLATAAPVREYRERPDNFISFKLLIFSLKKNPSG